MLKAVFNNHIFRPLTFFSKALVPVLINLTNIKNGARDERSACAELDL